MKSLVRFGLSAIFMLGGCMPTGHSEAEIAAANEAADLSIGSTALVLAQSGAAMGDHINVEELAATPRIGDALAKQALSARLLVQDRLKDPTSPLWGETWTVGYRVYCGTVNGKNSFGAYSGSQRYVASSMDVVAIEGDDRFSERLWKLCEGEKRSVLPGSATT